MTRVILIKIGELVLKGLNRTKFESSLIKNIKRRISGIGKFEILNMQSTIYLIPKSKDINFNKTVEVLKKIFGITSISIAYQMEKNIDVILEKTCEHYDDILSSVNSFKIETKRADKKFKLKSPEISSKLGEYILDKFKNLSVDVHNPDVEITVEIRDFAAFTHIEKTKGAGGMPTGTAGKAAVLISGGIDSPVAAWMMAKRGVVIDAIHFLSPPYTSERAEKKVINLLEKVSQYSGRINLFKVPFTEIQEEIYAKCREDLFTIIMRRLMFKISNKIATNNQCSALITGESLGQVASQTMSAISCVDKSSDIPVFRPLIGMDKNEIVSISRKIETFDISIQPFEDCCTVFTPKHPKLNPELKYIEMEESKLDLARLIQNAIDNLEINNIMPTKI